MELFSEYFKKNHKLSKIDARVKLVFALALLAMVLSYKGFFFPLGVLACCLAGCMYMRVPLRVFLLRFSEPLFIVSVLILLKFFFAGKEALFTVSLAGIQVTGYSDGIKEGLMIASRILGAVSVVAVLGFSTPFTEFMSALSWMRVPKGFIEILMLAYRYVFVLLEDAMVIYNAQKNRLGYSGIRRGLGSFGTLTGSLVLKAFENSQNITTAMIQRGYDGSMPMMKHKPFRMSEIIASAAIITAMGVVWKIY